MQKHIDTPVRPVVAATGQAEEAANNCIKTLQRITRVDSMRACRRTLSLCDQKKRPAPSYTYDFDVVAQSSSV